MTPYPPALAAHLEGDVTTVCHCWRLMRKDGTVLGFTDHDRPITVEGTPFLPETGFSASEARSRLGLAVDTVDVEGALSTGEIGEEDIASGLLDDAMVETLLVNWRDASQFAVVRTATLGTITCRDGHFIAELKSRAHALDKVSGRRVLRSCDAELGDGRCRFVLAQPGYQQAGSVASMVGASSFTATGLGAFSSNWFAHGRLDWTTGASAGRSTCVEAHRREGTAVTLTVAASEGPPAGTGDAFIVSAGCDKSFATCKAKFSNALNFQGFPHLPGNDAAYSYVAEGTVFDGRPLVP